MAPALCGPLGTALRVNRWIEDGMELTEQRSLTVTICVYDAISPPFDPSQADGSRARGF